MLEWVAQELRGYARAGRLLVWLLSLGLAACATPQTASRPGLASVAGALPAIAVQAPIGLPASHATRLADSLITALQRRSVSLAQSAEAAARFKLQGVCSAAPGDAGTSFVCVWDALDQSGQRAQRIVTEEQVRGGAPGDPYSVVSDATLAATADTVAARIAAWLPSAPQGSAPLISLPQLSGPSRAPPLSVVSVSGAPGDGNSALLAAIGGALRAENVPVSAAGAGAAYRLSGRVAVSDAGAGEQSVVIEWSLADPQGTPLGVVTQRNRVPTGALDTRWGKTAQEAAQAAAPRVVQLLPGRG